MHRFPSVCSTIAVFRGETNRWTDTVQFIRSLYIRLWHIAGSVGWEQCKARSAKGRVPLPRQE